MVLDGIGIEIVGVSNDLSGIIGEVFIILLTLHQILFYLNSM